MLNPDAFSLLRIILCLQLSGEAFCCFPFTLTDRFFLKVTLRCFSRNWQLRASLTHHSIFYLDLRKSSACFVWASCPQICMNLMNWSSWTLVLGDHASFYKVVLCSLPGLPATHSLRAQLQAIKYTLARINQSIMKYASDSERTWMAQMWDNKNVFLMPDTVFLSY